VGDWGSEEGSPGARNRAGAFFCGETDRTDRTDRTELRGGFVDGWWMGGMKQYFFQGLECGKVDPVNGVIFGVSVITSGIKARGHDLEVDRKTLEQLKECGDKIGTVPVKWNHRTGADAVAGYLTNFRIEGAKLLGDWHLLKSHDKYAQAIEMAERMPKNVGLSAAFMGEDEKVWEGAEARTLARCSELISVDLVAQPAANPNGLFEARLDGETEKTMARVDNENKEQSKIMAEENQNKSEPTLNDVMQALNALNSRIEGIEAVVQNGGLEEVGEELTEQDLAEILSLTPEQIDAALQSGELTEADVADIISLHEAVAEGSGEGELAGDDQGMLPGGDFNGAGVAGGAGGYEQGGEAAGAGADAGAAMAGTALGALHRQVKELSARFEREDRAKEENETEHYFATIERNFAALAEDNAQLKEFTGKLQTENEALRHALKTGVRPLAFSAEGKAITGQNGELHEFQALVQKHLDAGKTEAQAIRMAHKENPDAHRDYLRELGA
jgi:hypothetical protein